MSSGRSPITGIDSVIKFLQVQKDAYIRQEKAVSGEREDLQRQLAELEKALEEEQAKERQLKASLDQHKADLHPVSAVASGRLEYKGHHRTRSDLKGSCNNLREPKGQMVPSHTRKKSHQDYLLRLETELPSHIRKNIKTLIANRMVADPPTGKHLKIADLSFKPGVYKHRSGKSKPLSGWWRSEYQTVICSHGSHPRKSDDRSSEVEVKTSDQVKSMASFKTLGEGTRSVIFMEKEGSEHYCVTVEGGGEVRVWTMAHLLNLDIQTKNPLMVYKARGDSVTSLCPMANFMSLPIFAMGTSSGQIRLVAVTQSARPQEMVIGSWAAYRRPAYIEQLERLGDSSVVASRSGTEVAVWKYSLADEGFKADLQFALNDFAIEQTIGSRSQVSAVEWCWPRSDLVIGLRDDASLLLVDPVKPDKLTRVVMKANRLGMIEASCIMK